MKKFYSLVATAVFAVATFAQTTVFNATFDDLDGTGGNDNAWTGNIGTKSLSTYTTAGWIFGAAGGGSQCIKAGSGSTAGAVTTPALTGLSGNATLTFRAAGFSTDNTSLTVTITGGGSISGTSTFTLTNSEFSTYTVNIQGGTAATKLRFASAAGGRRFFIDDIKLVSQGALAVNDTKSSSVKFIKNTSVENEIYFGVQSDVKIFNVSGQLVKTASVKENGTLNILDLEKGIYIVAGNINGKAVSEKIIKR
ncbi:Por secretion system C-terminal sorting domain-containing protein [Chryseobacterium oleae]|uniref:Por secretion system C-terminal sorting domain-containing protein n=1 Tax=Chryseobacterium oleae TaxID=491207 RepID=A0A1I4WQQ0_CHROL|nr:T9SS type A sorting domain-containing protein [Chryseobacterium oleae]SFN16108.1 Por secretion system C-terminal sorting domain-containing protein [Chryseobacterium oleae]